MSNEIAILIVGTGENSIQFKVGEPAFWNYEMRNAKRRAIEVIKEEFQNRGEKNGVTSLWSYFVGYDKKDTKDANILFEVPVGGCIVIYKAALEEVDE